MSARFLVCATLLVTSCGGGCSRTPQLPPNHESPRDFVPALDRMVWVTDEARQTILGTQTLLNYGHSPPEIPGAEKYGQELIRRLVDETGIDVVRLEVRPGMEKGPAKKMDHCWSILAADHTATAKFFDCGYEAANDNEDPNVFAPEAFQFDEVDALIEGALLPLFRRYRAMGRPDPYVILTPNSRGTGGGGFQLADHPEEYAEFVTAAFLHVQRRYGITINALEVMNEPDMQWSAESRVYGSEAEEPAHLARCILAAERRLRAEGFDPEFFGPSVEDMVENYDGQCSQDSLHNCYVEAFVSAEASLATVLDYITYHRYQHRDIGPPVIAAIAKKHGLKTAQTEYINYAWGDMVSDLTVVNASLIAQYGLGDAFDHQDDGTRLYMVGHKDHSKIERASRTDQIIHFSREVRRGAVRHVATKSHPDVREPMAFKNSDGRWVVMFEVDAATEVHVGGIPAGRYGWFFSAKDLSARTLEQPPLQKGPAPLVVKVSKPGWVTVYELPSAITPDAGLGDAWPERQDSGFHRGAR